MVVTRYKVGRVWGTIKNIPFKSINVPFWLQNKGEHCHDNDNLPDYFCSPAGISFAVNKTYNCVPLTIGHAYYWSLYQFGTGNTFGPLDRFRCYREIPIKTCSTLQARFISVDRNPSLEKLSFGTPLVFKLFFEVQYIY